MHLPLPCTTGIGLMGVTYAGLYFGEEACRTSLLWEKIYFLAVICVPTRHATVTFIWPDYANLRKLYYPVTACVLRLWHYSRATTTRRTLNLPHLTVLYHTYKGRNLLTRTDRDIFGRLSVDNCSVTPCRALYHTW